MKLAAQLYTLRDFTRTGEGFYQVLRRCREIGYEGVQLSAVACMGGSEPEVDVATARTWLDEFRLECCATHRAWSSLTTTLDQEIEFHKTLGCSYLALGSIGGDFGYEPASYDRFLAEAKPIAEKLGQQGIKFGYHNHAHEFVRNAVTGRPCIEILSDPSNAWLQMEIDTYWVAEAGVCPADFLESCKDRIWAIHVKDREMIVGEGPVMAPVGTGNLNWDSILRVCQSGGTEWLIVEQDTCRDDPYACLESSYCFLSQVL